MVETIYRAPVVCAHCKASFICKVPGPVKLSNMG